jgi:hypothetical protein
MTDTRWVATTEPGEGKTWHARAEFYRATQVQTSIVCPHKHRSEKAAIACARDLVGIPDMEERVAL